MNILVNVFLCVTVLPKLCESLNSEPVHFGKWLQNADNENTDLYTFEWIVKVSISDCIKTCKSTKVCQFINYEVRNHRCSLIRTKSHTNNTNVAVIERKPGWAFGNKSEWALNRFSKCDECANHGECHIDGSSDSEYDMCRNSGCEKAPDGADFHGNSFVTGSSLMLKCCEDHRPFSQNITTCLENGTWTMNMSACVASFFNESCYSLQTNLRTWQQAKDHCKHLSGHLVDINSEEEQKFLDRFLTDFEDLIWTGGNDIETESYFRWSGGSDFSAYEHWAPGNPNNMGGREDCVNIMKSGSTFYWNDNDCSRRLQSICEFQ